MRITIITFYIYSNSHISTLHESVLLTLLISNPFQMKFFHILLQFKKIGSKATPFVFSPCTSGKGVVALPAIMTQIDRVVSVLLLPENPRIRVKVETFLSSIGSQNLRHGHALSVPHHCILKLGKFFNSKSFMKL